MRSEFRVTRVIAVVCLSAVVSGCLDGRSPSTLDDETPVSSPRVVNAFEWRTTSDLGDVVLEVRAGLAGSASCAFSYGGQGEASAYGPFVLSLAYEDDAYRHQGQWTPLANPQAHVGSADSRPITDSRTAWSYNSTQVPDDPHRNYAGGASFLLAMRGVKFSDGGRADGSSLWIRVECDAPFHPELWASRQGIAFGPENLPAGTAASAAAVVAASVGDGFAVDCPSPVGELAIADLSQSSEIRLDHPNGTRIWTARPDLDLDYAFMHERGGPGRYALSMDRVGAGASNLLGVFACLWPVEGFDELLQLEARPIGN